jgi:hypothetical protein
MVQRILKLATLALGLAVLSSLYGCATGANSGAMSISSVDMPTSANAELKGKAAVRYVGGGKETNPMLASQVDSNSFKSALSQSLRVAGYESSGVATYFVDAQSIRLKIRLHF